MLMRALSSHEISHPAVNGAEPGDIKDCVYRSDIRSWRLCVYKICKVTGKINFWFRRVGERSSIYHFDQKSMYNISIFGDIFKYLMRQKNVRTKQPRPVEKFGGKIQNSGKISNLDRTNFVHFWQFFTKNLNFKL